MVEQFNGEHYIPYMVLSLKAGKAIDKLKKKNLDIEPIIIEGRSLAKTW